jgi:integrase
LATIDRCSPIGKRDYAICVLIARLGMRIGDVRELRFENVDWNKGIIRILQQKTKMPLEIPLTEEVGKAMIDYLKNGRPQTEYRQIFVLQNSPFCPFGNNNNLQHVIDKYRRNAGITLPVGCRHGFHSLRHTVATRLLEKEVPIHVIASLLGHSSVEATRHYAKVNIEQLRKAALEWKEDDHE